MEVGGLCAVMIWVMGDLPPKLLYAPLAATVNYESIFGISGPVERQILDKTTPCWYPPLPLRLPYDRPINPNDGGCHELNTKTPFLMERDRVFAFWGKEEKLETLLG